MKKIWIVLIIFTVLYCSLCGCEKEPEICVDPAPADFQNTEELFEMVRVAKQKQDRGEELSQYEEFVVDLEEIPRPVVDTEKYTLIKIIVMSSNIRYYYCSASELESCGGDLSNFNFNEYIQISYDRDTSMGIDGFGSVVRQMGLEVDSNDVAYDENRGEMYFRYGLTWGYVRGTETLKDYDLLLPFCEYDMIPIPGI